MECSMSMIDALVFELNMEMATTRRHFERIKPEHMTYKPHEKSMALGALAAHTVETVAWMKEIVDLDVFELDMENYKPPAAETPEALLELADTNLKIAVDTLQTKSDADLFTPWKMVAGGRTVMEGVPKIGVIRSFVLSHLIHHRGQLTVYMRLCDIPIPKTYGPTADEPEMDFCD